ncbi:MAG: hypothetical protein HKO66_12285, partial [Saprospiraceae bacterium]|nr:hypothetical protein [Saprospiraceae bacterium]
DINNPNYKPEADDISIRARIEISEGDKTMMAHPIYVIRNGRPFSIKDYIPENGFHIRLTQIIPDKEKFTFQLAQDNRENKEIIIDIAENVPRTDFIALEATVFPGINMFWLGALMMMIGLLVAFFHRLKQKIV